MENDQNVHQQEDNDQNVYQQEANRNVQEV